MSSRNGSAAVISFLRPQQHGIASPVRTGAHCKQNLGGFQRRARTQVVEAEVGVQFVIVDRHLGQQRRTGQRDDLPSLLDPPLRRLRPGRKIQRARDGSSKRPRHRRRRQPRRTPATRSAASLLPLSPDRFILHTLCCRLRHLHASCGEQRNRTMRHTLIAIIIASCVCQPPRPSPWRRRSRTSFW